MKKLILPAGFCLIALLFAGCLATPVAKTGGMGAVTVTNTNAAAIMAAARNVFPQYGYTPGYGYGNDISFDKPAGRFGNAAFGSYGVTATIRANLSVVQIPGTNDYRLSVKPRVVDNAGQAGFEDSRRMLGVWSAEYGPLLKQIQAQANGAGPGI